MCICFSWYFCNRTFFYNSRRCIKFYQRKFCRWISSGNFESAAESGDDRQLNALLK